MLGRPAARRALGVLRRARSDPRCLVWRVRDSASSLGFDAIVVPPRPDRGRLCRSHSSAPASPGRRCGARKLARVAAAGYAPYPAAEERARRRGPIRRSDPPGVSSRRAHRRRATETRRTTTSTPQGDIAESSADSGPERAGPSSPSPARTLARGRPPRRRAGDHVRLLPVERLEQRRGRPSDREACAQELARARGFLPHGAAERS